MRRFRFRGGISESPSAVEDSKGEGSESSEEVAASGEDTAGAGEDSRYPISTDGLELSIFITTSAVITDFENNDFTKYMEDLTGIHMEFITSTGEDAQTKLNMLMESNDYPDIIFDYSAINLEKYGVEEGIIIPLDDYLTEDIMPNYLNVMKEFDLGVTRETDGKIYSLADINDCFHCKYGRKMWVNTYYLDQIKCEVPTTTEEFKEVCKKFLEYKPDGVAVAGSPKGWFTRMEDWLMGAYTFVPESSETFTSRDLVALDSDTGKMVCVATTDEYKEGLKYINELYNMGAIYDGDFTQTNAELKSLVNQADEPVLFFTAGASVNVVDSTANNELYRHYECMSPIAGPDGTRIAWTQPNYGVYAGGACVTDKCEDVEAALRWLDFFYTDEGNLISQFGPDEGVDWVMNPEGKVGLNEKPALYEVLTQYSSEAQSHDWQDHMLCAPEAHRLGQATETGLDPFSPEGLEKMLYDATAEKQVPYSTDSHLVNLNKLKITSAESSEVATIAVEIEKLIDETSVAFMTGKPEDIDAGWDAFVESLDRAGLPALIEMYQTAYDRLK